MGESVIVRSFGAGELAPGYGARADIDRYQQALRTCRNFIVRRAGGVANRPGFKFWANAKHDGETFLFPFVFAGADQSFVVEAGDNYFRFHHRTGPVRLTGVAAYSGATAYEPGDIAADAGVNYYCIAATTGNAPPNVTYWYAMPADLLELPTPWPRDAFMPPAPLCWHQAGTVVSLTHLNYPPKELAYFAQTHWVLRDAVAIPFLPAPGGVAAVPGAAGPLTMRYKVTAVRGGTFEESEPSAIAIAPLSAVGTPAAPVVVTWGAVTGAAEYNVYRDDGVNNTFGYVGTTTGLLQFNDIGVDADLAFTPPQNRAMFTGPNDYPGVSAVHNQRRIYAGTHTGRDLVYASRVGLLDNFTFRSPVQDDDSLSWRTVTKELQVVVHLVSLQRLIMLTDRGEWIVRGDEDGVLTPTTISPLQLGYVGAWWTTPVLYGEKVLFVQARGTVLRELGFSNEVEGLTGRDLTMFAGHLFRTRTIDSMAFALVPDACVWVVRSDGVLLGLTYIPDENVLAWHRHDTDGEFEQVCVIPENQEDAVYVVVHREVDIDDDGNLETVRYIERLSTRDYLDVRNACFLDSAITYDGAPTQTISGLQHLAHKSVRAFADGHAVAGTFTVSAAGQITLPAQGSRVHVGLPITADLESLDLDVGGSAVRDKRKKVTSLAVLLEESVRGFSAGPDVDHLKPTRAAQWEVGDEPFTGRVELTPTTYYNDYGRIFIRHVDPAPLTILGLLPVVDVGG